MRGAATGAIDQGVGAVIAGGSVTVSPAATTTYTLTVTAADNSTTTATVTVTVKAFVPKFVYVANDADGSISGFTLNNVSGALTSTGAATATGTHARHLATDVQARFVFVVNNSASTISVYGINGTTGALTLKGSPVATASGPWCSSVDPTGQFVYVRCNGKLSAFTLNGSNGALALINTYTTSTGAGDVIVHPSGKYVISTGDTSSKVDVFTADATTGALSNNAAYALMGGTGPRGVAVDPTGQYVFAKAEDNPSYITAYKLDITTGALSTWAGSLSGPYTGFDSWHGMAFSPTLNVLYTTFYNAAQDVAANGINLATGALTPLVGSPYAWFGGSGSDQVAISRDGQWAFATCYGTNRIGASSVNASTGALSSSPTLYTVGSHPVSVLVAGVLQ